MQTGTISRRSSAPAIEPQNLAPANPHKGSSADLSPMADVFPPSPLERKSKGPMRPRGASLGAASANVHELRRTASDPALLANDADSNAFLFLAEENVRKIEEYKDHLLGIFFNEKGNLESKISELSNDLQATLSTLDLERNAQQSAAENANKNEQTRRKHAVEKAMEREAKIKDLSQELERERKRSGAYEEYAAKADEFIQHSQKRIDELKYQLDNAQFSSGEMKERISRIAQSNKALIEKSKEVIREQEQSHHQMDLTTRDMMDAALRAKETRGLALIQRDMAHAQLSQQSAVGSSSADIVSRDKKLMRALTDGKPDTSKNYDIKTQRQEALAMRQGAAQSAPLVEQARRHITPEIEIARLKAYNAELAAANKQLDNQVASKEAQFSTLLEVNRATLAKTREYKLALERLCQKLGIDPEDLMN